MKIRAFILLIVAAFMLSSCGKAPESDIVQTNPENDVTAVTTTEESTADNIDTIDEGEDIDFFDDGEAIETSPPAQNTGADEPTETPESVVTTTKKTDPSKDVLQFEAVYNPEKRNIDITVINNGETILEYGAMFEIEVLKGDSWEFYYSPEAYDLWLAELYPGDTGRDTIGFIEADYLPAGTYRILKEINGADRYSNEFVVE